MEAIWKDFLVTSQSVHWAHSGNRWLSLGEPQFRVLNGSEFSTLTPARLAGIQEELARIGPGLRPAAGVLARLAAMAPTHQNDQQWRRDALDMARTIASRALLATLMKASLEMEAWRSGKSDAARIGKLAELSKRLMDALADVLAQSDDFSVQASLDRLKRAHPLGGVQPAINPHSEQTLKSNAENDYCRSHHYELVRHVYRPELEAYWTWVLDRLRSGDKGPWRRPAKFGAEKTAARAASRRARPTASVNACAS
jgi:hypothetical protein